MARNNWTEKELILALELYFRLPKKELKKENKEVVQLAQIIGRTPGAVASKFTNFLSCDPNTESKGWDHTGKLDKPIFDKYCLNMQELSEKALAILATYDQNKANELENDLLLGDLPTGVDKNAPTKVRVGQSYFRRTVLSSYDWKCCVTGISNPELLTASHIKPWKVSDEKTERTNPKNGLCLNALHDKAFDRGFITINSDYKIIVSKCVKELEMDDRTREWFLSYENQSITLPKRNLPDLKFIEYHNDVVFKK